MMHMRSPKRFDSNISSSAEDGGQTQLLQTVPTLALDDEISQLKEKNAQLVLENEMLKNSLLLLSSKLAKLGRRNSDPGWYIFPPTPTMSVTPGLPPPPSTQQQPYSSILLKRYSSRDSLGTNNTLSSSRIEEEDQKQFPSVGLVCRATLVGHESAVYSCKYAPTESVVCSTSLDCTVRLWREASEDQPWTGVTLGRHEQSGTDVHFLHKASVVSSSMDMTVKVWDIHTQRALHTNPCEGISLCVTVLDAHSFVIGTSLGALQLFDTRATGTAPVSQGRLELGGNINALCNGDFGVLSGDSRGALRYWDVRGGFTTSEVLDGGANGGGTGKRPAICSMSIGGNKRLAIYSHDNCVRVYEKQDGALKLVQSLRGQGKSKDWPVRASFAKDNSGMLVTGSLTRQAFVYSPATTNRAAPNSNPEDLSLLQRLEGHSGGVYECDFSSDSSSIVTCSADGLVKIWS
ncbi:hypothetical protein BASA81_009073 [Batrachochytrium salamandrivorans]|nr:hypothetical protein BASA81_009073 [Batrachochytrium salamandrivorans]